MSASSTPGPSIAPPAKRKHPLPGFCWVWIAGALYMAWIALAFQYGARNPGEAWEGHEWKLWTVCGLFAAATAGYAAFWVFFARKRRLNRRTWHTGTGLTLAGAAMLFLINQLTAAVVYLLVLAVWTQGHTRQFFDKS